MYKRFIIMMGVDKFISDREGNETYDIEEAYLFETLEDAKKESDTYDCFLSLVIIEVLITEERILKKNFEFVSFKYMINEDD